MSTLKSLINQICRHLCGRGRVKQKCRRVVKRPRKRIRRRRAKSRRRSRCRRLKRNISKPSPNKPGARRCNKEDVCQCIPSASSNTLEPLLASEHGEEALSYWILNRTLVENLVSVTGVLILTKFLKIW
nr:unnamed protein product [Callosobruchus chinensis]